MYSYFKFNLVFNIKRSSFLCSSLFQIIKRIQFPIFTIPCQLLWKGIFIFSLSRITRLTPLKPKIFWGRTPTDHPRHIYNMKFVLLCREEGFAIVPCPPENEPVCINNVWNVKYKRTDALSLWHQQ